jgi:hypothetical protein
MTSALALCIVTLLLAALPLLDLGTAGPDCGAGLQPAVRSQVANLPHAPDPTAPAARRRRGEAGIRGHPATHHDFRRH